MKLPPIILPVCLLFVLAHAAWGDTRHRARKRPSKERNSSQSSQSNQAVQPVEEALGPGPELLAPDREEERYEAAKEQARTDPGLRELKEKSDTAVGENEQREAASAYYRALFRKIRELDATLTDRTNLAEEALLRRLNE